LQLLDVPRLEVCGAAGVARLGEDLQLVDKESASIKVVRHVNDATGPCALGTRLVIDCVGACAVP
jgi:hypothetical protein